MAAFWSVTEPLLDYIVSQTIKLMFPVWTVKAERMSQIKQHEVAVQVHESVKYTLDNVWYKFFHECIQN